MKVYVVWFYCGEYNHGERCRSVVRIFKTEKEAKLYTVYNNFLEDYIFSEAGYEYEEVEIDDFNLPEDEWEMLIEEIKAQIDEYGYDERVKKEIDLIKDLIPEKYKRLLILSLL